MSGFASSSAALWEYSADPAGLATDTAAVAAEVVESGCSYNSPQSCFISYIPPYSAVCYTWYYQPFSQFCSATAV